LAFEPENSEPASDTPLQQIAACIPGAFVQTRVDPAGQDRIAHISSGCVALWELDSAALMNSAGLLRSMTEPHDVPRLQASITFAASSGQDWSFEWRITTPSGQRKWLRGVGQCRLETDGAVVLNAFVSDLTDSKRGQQAMLESEARFRQLLEDIPNVSVQGYGLDMTTRYWNRGSEHLYGYTAQEAIGTPLTDLIIPPHMREAVEGAVAEMTQSGRAIPSGDLTLVRKDGSPVNVYSSHVYLDIPGREPEFYCIDFDLTERHNAEALRAQLELQLRESQKMEALGTLAGGVAHDFNNIVAAIMGNTALALDDIPAQHPAHVSLLEIRKASHRARTLVQQILAFSRRQVMERQVISLQPLVDESVGLLRATLPAGVVLRVHCTPDTPAVLADATQIEQVLLNLCTNAWQAVQDTPAGAVDVTLTHHTSLPPEAGPTPPGPNPEAWACLRVSDNGMGMDEATRERMFEPFFTTKPPGKGTGLGLAVVHGILRDHQAVLDVRSAPGQGSTFTIYLPAAPASESLALPEPVAESLRAKPPHGATAPAKRPHILYVDDDDMIVFLMQRLMEREGYRASVFTDAEQALSAIRAPGASFDLVITDYNMPGMSGLNLTRVVRQLRPALPVAITSGHITEELQQQARALGVSELIYKPNTVEELFAAVDRLVRHIVPGATPA
jgi:PAS domain S-box-containing protein